LPPRPLEVSSENAEDQQATQRWDIFICHASEDKDNFVRPLATALQKKGLSIWYDDFTLKVGDSLRQSIDRGLSQSRYGVVVLSPAFFGKHWPERELDGLVAKEVGGKKVILPVWHNVTADDVRNYSLTLADRVAASSSEGLKAVVEKLIEAMRG
ncbi:MAG: toll/interleukin-1 receptor domain-containing protein, partial [Acidobacteria bacterium]|nr:toll/interleukin-1 receptor domain-containing protein [Acidobacteriota bacterium]